MRQVLSTPSANASMRQPHQRRHHSQPVVNLEASASKLSNFIFLEIMCRALRCLARQITITVLLCVRSQSTLLTIRTNPSQGENCHHRVKLNAQSRCNNKETDQQLGEMDYIDFQVRRIADDLQRAGVSIPGHTPTTNPTHEPQQEAGISIARGHKSTVYLPRWMHDHREDPALTVSTFFYSVVPSPYTSASRASWTSYTPTFANGSFRIQMQMKGYSSRTILSMSTRS